MEKMERIQNGEDPNSPITYANPIFPMVGYYDRNLTVLGWRRAVHTGVEHSPHRRRARLNVEHNPHRRRAHSS
ncbi:hypothetical protein A2U01_0020377 [Trifolium medium]|uniref:Uncharacterized protein n=1 Tax=Trifolium medium TaxID=97028 RepID=A0A392NJU5_9FABA|nr:hypothetical protein [Trifolium medium]